MFKSTLCFALFLAAVTICPAASVTYSFDAQVPTNNGLLPGSFTLTVPDFLPASPTQFMGTDFQSCSAPGTGTCLAQFSIGPSPISGLSDNIGFGNDNCCFIYFFPEGSFTHPGSYTADPFHSAAAATLTVSATDTPEPSTVGLVLGSLAITALHLWRARSAGALQK